MLTCIQNYWTLRGNERLLLFVIWQNASPAALLDEIERIVEQQSNLLPTNERKRSSDN